MNWNRDAPVAVAAAANVPAAMDPAGAGASRAIRRARRSNRRELRERNRHHGRERRGAAAPGSRGAEEAASPVLWHLPHPRLLGLSMSDQAPMSTPDEL